MITSMQGKQQKNHSWPLILVGGLFPLLLLLNAQLHLPQQILIPGLVIIAFIFCSMAVWLHANAHATGDEWWQDDSCSGWRGY